MGRKVWKEMILRREKSMVENMKSQGSRQDESLKREGKERRKSVRVCLSVVGKSPGGASK